MIVVVFIIGGVVGAPCTVDDVIEDDVDLGGDVVEQRHRLVAGVALNCVASGLGAHVTGQSVDFNFDLFEGAEDAATGVLGEERRLGRRRRWRRQRRFAAERAVHFGDFGVGVLQFGHHFRDFVIEWQQRCHFVVEDAPLLGSSESNQSNSYRSFIDIELINLNKKMA